jgi:hypothetical protein
MRSQNWHLTSTPFVLEGVTGFWITTAKDIPSFNEEPDMPSASDVRPWILLYYTEATDLKAEKYWESLGKKEYAKYQSRVKVSDEIRSAAAEITSGGQSEEEKLSKLLNYVRKDVRNTGYESETAQHDPLKENRTTADTFKQKAGSGPEITLLFIALAESQGFDARVAELSSRTFGMFDKDFADDYFLVRHDVAVKVNGQWKFCDPASPLLPFGMLNWEEEGQNALITDPKQPLMVQTPVAEPAASLIARRGTFKLAEDGSLEGDVLQEYTGHALIGRKLFYQKQSPEEREEAVRETVKARFGGAEVTAVKLEGVSDNLQTLKISYHVKIEDYAQRTGKRLFLKCSFFNRDLKPRYSTNDRRNPVFFNHAWSEKDTISYELPAGYSLEKAEAPQSFRAGDVAEQIVHMTINNRTHVLNLERSFLFGRGGAVAFPTATYPNLKTVFDRFQEMDDHTLIVKQDQAGGSN